MLKVTNSDRKDKQVRTQSAKELPTIIARSGGKELVVRGLTEASIPKVVCTTYHGAPVSIPTQDHFILSGNFCTEFVEMCTVQNETPPLVDFDVGYSDGTIMQLTLCVLYRYKIHAVDGEASEFCFMIGGCRVNINGKLIPIDLLRFSTNGHSIVESDKKVQKD